MQEPKTVFVDIDTLNKILGPQGKRDQAWKLFYGVFVRNGKRIDRNNYILFIKAMLDFKSGISFNNIDQYIESQSYEIRHLEFQDTLRYYQYLQSL